MKDQKDTLNGVGCDVMACKYHETGDQCAADSINVEAPNASEKTETFCGTFTPKK